MWQGCVKTVRLCKINFRDCTVQTREWAQAEGSVAKVGAYLAEDVIVQVENGSTKITKRSGV